MIQEKKNLVINARRERKSVAREFICQILKRADRPVSVGEILTQLGQQGRMFNKTTVYRELDVMKQKGVVREVFFRNDTALYELAGEHHHHLVCVSCGYVHAITLRESFADEVREVSKHEQFSVLDHSLEFFGLCRACQK